MNKLIRVYKDNEVYTFLRNKKRQLILYFEDKEDSKKSYTKIVEENVDEISAFVENNKSIYLILKKNDNLKCIILQEGVINTGDLYSYTKGNYRIYNSHMFIQGGNVNIVAILKSDVKEINDELIHYIYEGESVKKNVLRSLNKSLDYRDYVFDMGTHEVNLYYLDKIFSKEYVFERHLVGDKWSEEKKLYDVQGEIQSIDVKKKDDNIYLAIVEKVASIFAIRILILNRELKILTQKIHYSVFEVKKIHIVQQNELYVVWEEDNTMYITSPLCAVNSIETFKFDNKEVIVSQSFSIEKFSIINKNEILISNDDGKIQALNIESILNESLNKDVEDSDICNKDIEIYKNIYDNIVSLKDDISCKNNNILDKLNSFSLTDHSIDNYINELQILRAKKDTLEIERLEVAKVLELYEQTIKENYETINYKEEIIVHDKTLLEERELMIKELEDRLEYEQEKGLFKRVFRL